LSTQNREKVLVNELAIQKLLQLIKEENLQSGDKLPTERILCQKLGISRTSLREAFHSLKTNGIVRIRQGSGIFVEVFNESVYKYFRGPDTGNYQDILTIVNHMLDVRNMIEPYCVRQVAGLITPEQIKLLWEHENEEYKRLIYYQEGHTDTLKHPGLDFEQLIISFWGNPVISDLHNRLNVSWKKHLEKIHATVLSPDYRHRQHLPIIHALEEKKPSKAEKAMRYHLDMSQEALIMLINQYAKDPDRKEPPESGVFLRRNPR